MTKIISVTDMARSISDVIGQVYYQHTSFDIKKATDMSSNNTSNNTNNNVETTPPKLSKGNHQKLNTLPNNTEAQTNQTRDNSQVNKADSRVSSGSRSDSRGESSNSASNFNAQKADVNHSSSIASSHEDERLKTSSKSSGNHQGQNVSLSNNLGNQATDMSNTSTDANPMITPPKQVKGNQQSNNNESATAIDQNPIVTPQSADKENIKNAGNVPSDNKFHVNQNSTINKNKSPEDEFKKNNPVGSIKTNSEGQTATRNNNLSRNDVNNFDISNNTNNNVETTPPKQAKGNHQSINTLPNNTEAQVNQTRDNPQGNKADSRASSGSRSESRGESSSNVSNFNAQEADVNQSLFKNSTQGKEALKNNSVASNNNQSAAAVTLSNNNESATAIDQNPIVAPQKSAKGNQQSINTLPNNTEAQVNQTRDNPQGNKADSRASSGSRSESRGESSSNVSNFNAQKADVNHSSSIASSHEDERPKTSFKSSGNHQGQNVSLSNNLGNQATDMSSNNTSNNTNNNVETTPPKQVKGNQQSNNNESVTAIDQNPIVAPQKPARENIKNTGNVPSNTEARENQGQDKPKAEKVNLSSFEKVARSNKDDN